ncbi:MAG: hypothetical protein JOZ41_19515 [Chloroflexi bacterium]|nr:hypothetical protein [Chloroflexota bacterium]
MLTSLDQEIRAQVRRYVAQQIRLDEFTEWFLPVMWRAEESGDQTVADLASKIDLRLIEHSNGDWTEAELRELLGPLASNAGEDRA